MENYTNSGQRLGVFSKWIKKLMICNISDALTIESNMKEIYNPYTDVQNEIQEKLNNLYDESVNKKIPIIIVANSLGGLVISNYIWDAQAKEAKKGIWKGNPPMGEKKEDKDKDEKEKKDDFLRLKNLKYLFTTGCNIPLFVAGLDIKDIISINTNCNGYDFQWYNYYDKNDLLGWPLEPLSKSYSYAVTDIEIKVKGILKGWNPWCHLNYWKTDAFINDLVEKIEEVIDC